MINFFLKSGFIFFISIWLKPRWKGMLSVFLIIIGISLAQSEYIDYLSLVNDFTYAGWSYLGKWAAILLAVVGYYFFIEVSIKKVANEKSNPTSKPRSADKAIAKRSAKRNDGFDFLREKKELKSRSQKILEE